jgi:acetylornithine deacetylase
MEDPALGALDVEGLARDAAALVRVPSVTGDERAALELLAEQAQALGLEVDLHQHDRPPCARIPATPARRRRAASCGA